MQLSFANEQKALYSNDPDVSSCSHENVSVELDGVEDPKLKNMKIDENVELNDGL